MKNNLRVIHAGTAAPNTPETDRMPVIKHRVHGTFIDTGEEWGVLIMTKEPGDAIDKVKAMTDEQFAELEKIGAVPRRRVGP